MNPQHYTQPASTICRQRSVILHVNGMSNVLLPYVGTDDKLVAICLFVNLQRFSHAWDVRKSMFEIMDD